MGDMSRTEIKIDNLQGQSGRSTLPLMSSSAARVVDDDVEGAEDYQQRFFSAIEEGLSDEAAGRWYTHEEVRKELDALFGTPTNSDRQ